ncbi:TlpA family protein disulfide reductase [Tenacibaculum sp. MEBiC06402]|uniref:TlpA family protein disulfide reductase n=1 Tax=unclassified Tenacibaculum TaxID=2635139 RepID=UPI003B99BDF6
MKRLLALLIFVTSIANAQYSVKGTMTPPEESDWVILYKIEGAKQKFISNSTIVFEDVNIGGNTQKVGRFELNLPADAKEGAYRVTYRNQGAGFVDFFFNKENVEFVFNPVYPEESILFTKSRENKVYREYLEAIAKVQRILDSLQVEYLKSENKQDKKAYKKAYKEQEEIQDIYEGKSEGMLVNTYIKASKPTNSSSIFDDTQEYLNHVVGSFFDNVDFSNKKLYNSPFIVDKITNYVFYLNIAESQPLQQKLYNESIAKVMGLLKDDKVKKEVTEYLITRFANARNSEIVDGLFANYYDKLPSEFQDQKFRDDKVALLRATVGRIAPDFSWKEGESDYKLSTLNDGEKYLLVFWSTGCSHCLKEIPQLHTFMKTHNKTSVIAFGIEQEAAEWTEYIKKLEGWHNVMGTHPDNKWENEVVRTYQLVGTPTYFILNQDKKIIAMPNSFEDVKDYFENGNADKE